jgi:TRAP-type C4-dicarboxylate transport system substrate-binding protein
MPLSRSRGALLVAAALLLTGAPAAAEPTVLRMGTIAPDGSAWAREAKAFARDVAAATHDTVHVKWYFGAITGDEATALARAQAGQIDGVGGVMGCQLLSRSLHVIRLLGLFRTRDELRHVYSRLLDDVRAELAAAGFRGIAFAAFDFDVLFSKRPIRSMDELRRTRLWVWDLDTVWRQEFPLLGLDAVALPVDKVGAAFEAGTVEGLPALPTAALAFQWSAQARYFLDLPLAFMPACVMIANRAFDALTIEQRDAIIAAGAKFSHRFDDASQSLDQALLGGLFERQGLKRIVPSVAFRDEFLEAATRARANVPDKVVPQAVLTRVVNWLADFRAAHAP